MVFLATGYQMVGVLIAITLVMVVVMVLLNHFLSPKRTGAIKESTYESGVPVVGSARRRFNVKFYIVAMIFLLFDVEVVILWPWATLFHQATTQPEQFSKTAMTVQDSPVWAMVQQGAVGKEFLLITLAIFIGVLLIGFIYEWKRGVFRWS
ncbi:MAG: NAD(P)H-quinone oxidoreductase subunit 3 [Phycisphaerae bacterium]|nr:NAD(P)H-quinone oxidoreductase subunit 3 [Phycisphaerae bacterium]